MSLRAFGIGVGGANCSGVANGAVLNFENYARARNCSALRAPHSYIPGYDICHSQTTATVAAAAAPTTTVTRRPTQQQLQQHPQPNAQSQQQNLQLQKLQPQQKENDFRRCGAAVACSESNNNNSNANNNAASCGAHYRQTSKNERVTVFAERSNRSTWPAAGAKYRSSTALKQQPQQQQQANAQKISEGFRQGMKDVPQWLKSLRLHKYTQLFSRLTYAQLMALDERQLERCDVTQGARRKILQSVQSLRDRVPLLLDIEMKICSHANSVNATPGQQVDNLRAAITELRAIMNTPIGSDQVEECDAKQANNLPRCIARLVALLHRVLFDESGAPHDKWRNVAGLDDEYIIRLSQVYDKILNHEAFNSAQKQQIGHYRRLLRAHIHENGIRYNFGFVGGADAKLPYSSSSGYKNSHSPMTFGGGNLQKQHQTQQQQQLQRSAKFENCQPHSGYAANLHASSKGGENCAKYGNLFDNCQSARTAECAKVVPVQSDESRKTVNLQSQCQDGYYAFANVCQQQQQPRFSTQLQQLTQHQQQSPQLQQQQLQQQLQHQSHLQQPQLQRQQQQRQLQSQQPQQLPQRLPQHQLAQPQQQPQHSQLSEEQQNNNFRNWLIVLRDYNIRQQIGAIPQSEIAAANQILFGLLRNFPEFNEMLKKYMTNTCTTNTATHHHQQQQPHQQHAQQQQNPQVPQHLLWNDAQQKQFAATANPTMFAREEIVDDFVMLPHMVSVLHTATVPGEPKTSPILSAMNEGGEYGDYGRRALASSKPLFESESPVLAMDSTFDSWSPFYSGQESTVPSPNLPMNEKQNAFLPNLNAQKSTTTNNATKAAVTLSERSSSGYSSSEPSGSDRSSGAGSPPGLMVYNFFEDSLLSSAWTLADSADCAEAAPATLDNGSVCGDRLAQCEPGDTSSLSFNLNHASNLNRHHHYDSWAGTQNAFASSGYDRQTDENISSLLMCQLQQNELLERVH